MAPIRDNKPQLVFLFILSSVLTHALGQIQQANAASSSASETASSSQPLWSYQVKPNSYVNAPGAQQGHYSGVPSLFEAFNGLSQRQGALTSSPFLSILPIILIAAGGMLLLLPLLTMMMASPFGGGGFGGYGGGGFGYPQVGALSKKRSLADQFGSQRGLVDIMEHVSSTIEELSKKYSSRVEASPQRRAKSINSPNEATGQAPPSNHKLLSPSSLTGGDESNSSSSATNPSGSNHMAS